MHWFAAHAVYAFELLQGRQDTFTVVENILLVRGRSSKAALARAAAVARREGSDEDPSLTIGGKPARQKFLGIRKIVACAADPFDATSKDGLVTSIRPGAEATFLTYRVTSRTALRKLMAGKDADVTLEE